MDNNNNRLPNLDNILRSRPFAWAIMGGSESYSGIQGTVLFYESPYGVLVVSELRGLPSYDSPCESPIFAFHIHEGDVCSGNESDPFANARMHYNPNSCPHPYHAGDMPPIFGANGYALGAFLTDRFTIDEVVGRTVVLHAGYDDFSTQPSGNAGEKIACGEIIGRRRARR